MCQDSLTSHVIVGRGVEKILFWVVKKILLTFPFHKFLFNDTRVVLESFRLL